MIDEQATFAAAVEPLRRGLRLHCYRMLGSAHDSDDLVQEALLRAWRARGTLHDQQLVKPWLYRIATNLCLDELGRRPRRVLASDAGPSSPGTTYPPAARLEDAPWLEPMPDTWLVGAVDDPSARYLLRESVALAFVAALQVLTPVQRAALLLRDVVGLSADEAAVALEQSVDATHSALHRARAAVEARAPRREPAPLSAADQGVLERYVRAIEASDVEAMVALIHDDLHTTMPPSPTWVAGRADNIDFYRLMLAALPAGAARLVPVGVNGAAGFEYHRDGVLRAVEAVEVQDGAIIRMHHFMQPALVALFARARERATVRDDARAPG